MAAWAGFAAAWATPGHPLEGPVLLCPAYGACYMWHLAVCGCCLWQIALCQNKRPAGLPGFPGGAQAPGNPRANPAWPTWPHPKGNILPPHYFRARPGIFITSK